MKEIASSFAPGDMLAHFRPISLNSGASVFRRRCSLPLYERFYALNVGYCPAATETPSSPQELVEAVRAAARGESKLHPMVAARVLREMQQRQLSPLNNLTPRELEVLTRIARGRSNYEIAQELVISEPTVRTHVSNILSKLHLTDRTQAA